MESSVVHIKKYWNTLRGGPSRKTTENRQKELKNDRKIKRNNLAFARRGIDDNMSPYMTPDRPKTPHLKKQPILENEEVNLQNDFVTLPNTNAVPNARLKLLLKWKEEKMKQKEMEKAKKKPIFKVCHVSADPLLSIEHANLCIKGKPVPSLALKQTQFASANFTFKPPNGVRFNSTTRPNNKTTETNTRQIITRHGATALRNGLRLNSDTKPSKSEMDGFQKTLNIKSLTSDASGLTKAKFSTPSRKKKTEDSSTNRSQTKKSTNHKKSSPKKEGRKKITIEADQEEQISNESKKEHLKMNGSVHFSTPLRTKKRDILSARKGQAKENTFKKEMKQENATEPEQEVQACDESKNNNLKTNGLVQYSTSPRTNKIEVSSANESQSEKRNKSKKSTSKKEEEIEITTKPEQELQACDDSKKENLKANISSQVLTPSRKKKTEVLVAHKSQAKKNASKKDMEKDNKTEPEQELQTYDENNKKHLIMNGSAKKKVQHTPENKSGVVYISPFVTISRGKKNARDEYRVRHSAGKQNVSISQDILETISTYASPKVGAEYFLIKLNNETSRISNICQKWEECLVDPALPEEAISSISVAIGQSKLLISEKFKQFKKLITQCKSQQFEEGSITCEDLHGFWDMIYIQVEDLDKRFSNLDRLKKNNWSEMLPEKKEKRKTKKSKVQPKKTVVSSRLKDLIKEAREKQKLDANVDEKFTLLNGDSARVNTPKAQIDIKPASSKRKSSRISSLSRESKRLSSSPGLTMMKLSQSIKQGNGLTPASKSILKTSGYKSSAKKSVVFKESLSPNNIQPTQLFSDRRRKGARKSLSFCEDSKENTPHVLRRSARLSSAQS